MAKDIMNYYAAQRAFGGQQNPMADVVGTLNAFTEASKFMDSFGLEAREKKIAEYIGSSGGDVSSIPEELTKDRRGLQALGNVLDRMSKTKEGLVKINTLSDALAADTVKGLSSGLQAARDRFAQGDMEGGAKFLETATEMAKVPYSFKWNPDTKQVDMMHMDLRTGENVPMGRSFTPDQAAGELGKLLSDNGAFRKTFARHYATILDSNIKNAQNPDRDVTAVDAKGNKMTLTPFYYAQVGEPPRAMFRDGSGQLYSREDLASLGYGKILSNQMQDKEADNARADKQLAEQARHNKAGEGLQARSFEMHEGQAASQAYDRARSNHLTKGRISWGNDGPFEIDANGDKTPLQPSDPRAQAVLRAAHQAGVAAARQISPKRAAQLEAEMPAPEQGAQVARANPLSDIVRSLR